MALASYCLAQLHKLTVVQPSPVDGLVAVLRRANISCFVLEGDLDEAFLETSELRGGQFRRRHIQKSDQRVKERQ